MIIKLEGSIIWICSRQQGELICSRQLAKGYDINPINSTHVETVVLLGNQKTKPDSHIKLSVDMDEFNKVKNGEK